MRPVECIVLVQFRKMARWKLGYEIGFQHRGIGIRESTSDDLFDAASMQVDARTEFRHDCFDIGGRGGLEGQRNGMEGQFRGGVLVQVRHHCGSRYGIGEISDILRYPRRKKIRLSSQITISQN